VKHYDWTQRFGKLYDVAVKKFGDGQRGADSFFDPTQTAFLSEIGSCPQEIYDFAEDAVLQNEPDKDTALLVASVRRDYYLAIQKGKSGGPRYAMSDFPGKDEKLEGVDWLPRIIKKAEAKLEGRMPLEMMYGCGGDRKFLKDNDLHPADFLREVWGAKGDSKKILEYVLKH